MQAIYCFIDMNTQAGKTNFGTTKKEDAKNISWPWLSLLRGWGSVTMAFIGEYAYYIYIYIYIYIIYIYFIYMDILC